LILIQWIFSFVIQALICLKTRNGIVFSPHPRAKKATAYTVKLILKAAVAAGAPEDIIGCIEEPTLPLTQALMHHSGIDMILATGGPSMVKAAYSSAKPAIGVGAGNVPVVVDETADIKRVVSSILMSKTFDNGVVCASEQSCIVVDEIYDQVKKRFIKYGGFFLNEEDADKVRKVLFVDGHLNSKIVGQTALKIAELAGVMVPPWTKVLIGEGATLSEADEFALEKLSPTLGVYRAKDFYEAVEMACKAVALGGVGHTSCLYTDQDKNQERVEYFGKKMKTARILLNTPTSHGGIGDLYNFALAPSLTLGCGSWGGNSISENVGPKHLINKKTVAKREENMLWHKLPSSIYFRRGAMAAAMEDLKDFKRACIVTDKFLFNHTPYVHELIELLQAKNIECYTFYEVEADPTLTTIRRGTEVLNSFVPGTLICRGRLLWILDYYSQLSFCCFSDLIIAIGGGSPMDAAKMMWVSYEHPEVDFKELSLRFMDIRKRIFHFPKMGKKAKLVCIPTTSGTGSEVTPFAVVTDDSTGQKYPLADYELTPYMAIVDANLVMLMPKGLTAAGGIDAVTHAIEAYVSVLANEFSDGQALHALKLLKAYLPRAYKNGANDPVAREKVHNAATVAGIAFANSFLGVCHSMAHKIGAEFHIPHGIANGLLLCNTIRFNATNLPTKQTAFSQYDRPNALRRYGEIAMTLGFTQTHTVDRVNAMLEWLDQLKRDLDIPMSIQEWGVDENEFLSKVDQLAVNAFDDQCTGANPRFPLISELRDILLDSYYGRPFVEEYERGPIRKNESCDSFTILAAAEGKEAAGV
jgi:acetaldehyde dehydrogenase/alcohol dehydrogenase